MAENQNPTPKPALKPISVGFIPETRIGAASGGTLGSSAASSQFLRGQDITRVNNQIAAYEKQLETINRENARRAAEIDAAFDVASKITLEKSGAIIPTVDTPKMEVAGAPKGSVLLNNGTVKLPNGKIISNSAPVAGNLQGVNPVAEEKKRSKGIIDQTYGLEDPLSDELDNKIGDLTEQYLNAKSALSTNIANSAFSMGTVRANTDTSRVTKLEKDLENLKKQQAVINQYKSDLQIKKATEEYIANLKAKGQSFNSTTSKGLIDQVKMIKAQERNKTRGDLFYDDNMFEVYTKERMGSNDFTDYSHTDRSLGSLMQVVSREMQVADPTVAKDLQGVLGQLQKDYNAHAKSNQDAYDHFYGTSQRYREVGSLEKAVIYGKTQVVQPIFEGLSNFVFPFIPTTKSGEYALNTWKETNLVGDMILADLDGDNKITDRDRDHLGNYQQLGQTFTYTKEKVVNGKKVLTTEYNLGSIPASAIRTGVEMLPTLLLTRGLMGAGMGARLATFLPVAASSTVRSYEQNKKNYKSKLDAFNVGAMQGIIEGLTESIVPDIGYFTGTKSLATKSLSAAERKYAIATTLLPELNTMSTKARTAFLMGSSAVKQTVQEGLEEEISMFANYALNKLYTTKDSMYGELPEELDASSLESVGSSIWKTFAESAVAGSLMTGVSVYKSKKIDNNLLRFNVATNPKLFKDELTKLREKGEVTPEQYSAAILESNRLTQLKEQADRVMLNLVDPETLLDDTEKQFGYFNSRLKQSDLLTKTGLDFDKMTPEEQDDFRLRVEEVEKEIEEYENQALKYANSTPEEKEKVLESMITRNLERTSKSNDPSQLQQEAVALEATIRASELSGKGSPVMTAGRNQLMESIQKRIQELQSIEDNDNTVFENQLLNMPIEALGPSMRVGEASRISRLVALNSGNIRESVLTTLNQRLSEVARVAQEEVANLSPKEKTKVVARELARVEMLFPGTAFNKLAVEKLFNMPLTEEEHKEVVTETAKTVAREGEKISAEETIIPDEKDPIMNAVIANFQKEPEFIQQEDEDGNIVQVENPKRKQKRDGAIASLSNSKSKQQLRSRVKSLFSALGYTPEEVNKGLDDLNDVLDGVEPKSPGEIYDFLKYLNQEKLRALPATSEVTTTQDVTGEEEVITPEPEVKQGDITLDLEIPVETPVETPAEVVNPKLDGLTVKPVNHTNAKESKVSATSPTVFTNSNAVTQSNILKTVGKSPESYMVKVMDLFSFITEAIGKRAIPNLVKIYSKVGEAIKSGNQEEITALREEFMAIFPEGTFSTQMLDYIWEKQFILGKSDQNVTINNSDATPIQIAETYKKKEGVVTFFSGEKKISYLAEVTGKVVDGKIEVISKKGLKTSLVSPSSFTPSTVLPINARAEFFQINSVMATIVNKSNGKLSTFDMEGKKTSKGKVNALVPLSRQDSAINEVRENIKTNTPVNFTGPIVGNAAVTKAKSYEDSGVGVYLEFDNSNYSSTISTQTTVQFAPEVTTQPTEPAQIIDAKADIERRRQEELKNNNITVEDRGDDYYFLVETKGSVISLEERDSLVGKKVNFILKNPSNNKLINNYKGTIIKHESAGITGDIRINLELDNGQSFSIDRNGNYYTQLNVRFTEEIPNIVLEINAKYDAELAALENASVQPTDAGAEMIKDYVREVFTQARNSISKVRKKLTRVKDSTLSVGKKYVRVETDQEGNVYRVEIVTGTGKSFEYTFMSGYTGSGNTKSTARNFPTFIDESGKESGMMSPERLGYFFELPVLEQPAVDESAVVVDIPKDLMNILTGNVTNKATSSQNNPITPDQQNQEEDAASCSIK